MDFLRVNLDIKNLPELDPEFIPLHKFNEAFLRGAEKPVGIALERAGGEMAAVETRIHGTPEMYAADCYYIDRLVKTMLWMKGGYKIYVRGDARIYDYLRSVYCAGGAREFDWDYMANVFERPFEVVQTDTLPAAKDSPKAIGGHMDGCRIGFDAGGSDPEGLGSDKRRGRVLRGGRLVPENQLRSGLPLRRYRRRAQVCGRAHAAR